MHPKEMIPGTVLKKSPFLVLRRLDHQETRVYSEIHGNLSCFDFEIGEVLNIFDTPTDVEAALNEISTFYQGDPLALVKGLYERKFLVEGNKSKKEMLSEYIETVIASSTTPEVSKVTFLVSARCNLVCKGCYHSFYDFQSAQMTSELAVRILEGLFPYLKGEGIPEVLISFLGYEPLLNFETMKAIHEKACMLGEQYGIKTSFILFTNAFDISEEIFQWIGESADGFGVKVSLDGIKEDNDKRRLDFHGGGTYDRVVQNLRRLLNSHVECGVLTVLSKLNVDHIEKFVDEMAAIGIQTITANIFCGQSEDERVVELTDLEKIDAIKRMDLATEKKGIQFDGEWKYAVVQLIKGAQFSCPAGRRQLVFSADGAIYPCQRFAGTEICFETYEDDFWGKLSEGRCSGYNRWMSDFHRGARERTMDQDHADLAGWSCPFLSFLRGERADQNLERTFNEYLLDYYVTRPLARIMANSPMDCFGHSRETGSDPHGPVS